jgi:hypothetical protein
MQKPYPTPPHLNGVCIVRDELLVAATIGAVGQEDSCRPTCHIGFYADMVCRGDAIWGKGESLPRSCDGERWTKGVSATNWVVRGQGEGMH